MTNHNPLVSVGIPTYNRAESLKKTINSVINQTYSNLEIIISDNASTDGTQQVCEEFCQLDPRITYIRQSENFGATNNFKFVLEKASGEYFMWLADDDWISQDYIHECINYIALNNGYSLVGGLALYYSNASFSHTDIVLNLEANNAHKRVIEYYRQVQENGIFYGLMKTKQIKNIPMPQVMGADWHMVALLCFLGKVKTIELISLHRNSTWSEDYFDKLAKSLGLTNFHARYPRLSIAISSFDYMIKEKYFYRKIGFVERYLLAIRIFFVNVNRYYSYKNFMRRAFQKTKSLIS